MSAPEIVCDLVLLSWNHLEETQPCLESLFAKTGLPCRLFIVDNGSVPEVRAFLQTVHPQGAIREIILLQNETNEGFPRGMNRGLRGSTAPYVCILNNDLIFTSGWLEEMIALAQAHPEIGVVNPSSSTFGEAPAPGQPLDAYAEQIRRRAGQHTEVGMCIGFCMLITRAVLERIGGLSEEVERCFFEDEDFCMRAQAAGWRCVVAEGAYVFHAEHKSVQKMPEREALFARNRAWCEERWGRWGRVLWLRRVLPARGSPQLRELLAQLTDVARRRTRVYVYAPQTAAGTGRELFDSVGLVPHADVHWHLGAPALIGCRAFWRLVTRHRRKPFNVVVAPASIWRTAARSLAWWHRAVVVEENIEAIVAACQAQSRSLL